MPKITIDGKEYDTDTMSDQAKNTLGLIQFTEREIQHYQAKTAALQTARLSYIATLKTQLETLSVREENQASKETNETEKKKGFLGGLFSK